MWPPWAAGGVDLAGLIVSEAVTAFDPRTIMFEGPDLARGSGAGLPLIRAWGLIADYRPQRGRNRVIFDMLLS
jgi:hypothetical protein